ncbi:MAG: efflux RND transporter periplasmic adaptor subunit [Gammaproteobacteria bacterium]|nr:efflux RND transporter periplasmic adaptor subunit [Gammaproteobacteria bacterium]
MPQLLSAPVVREELPLDLTVEGTVEAIRQATVSAQVSGSISQLNVDVNDFVEQGAVLLEFEGVQNRAALDQARAAIGMAEAQVRDAERELKRIENLHERKLVADAMLDKARTTLNTAEETLRSAQAGASAAADQAGDTLVRAPFSGYITKRHVQLGENANPGEPLFSMVSLEALRVVTRIPQTYLSAVQTLWHAHVEVARPGAAAPRRLQVLDMNLFPYAEQGTHQVGVRLSLEEGISDLLPGMLVKAVFAIGEKPRLLIPAQAVFRRSEVSGVYVLKDGRVSLRQVRLGKRFADERIEVLAGLEPGEQVLLDVIAAGIRLKAQLDGDA